MISYIGVALNVPLKGLFHYQWPLPQMPLIGTAVIVPWGRAKRLGWIWEVCPTPPEHIALERIKSVVCVLHSPVYLNQRWRQLVEFASRYYHHPLGACVFDVLPKSLKSFSKNLQASSILQTWLKKNLACVVFDLTDYHPNEQSVLLEPYSGFLERNTVAQESIEFSERPLTLEQVFAVETLRAVKGFKVHLLHGITGSGKTEVYLRLIVSAIQDQKQCLLLLPEINLTPAVEAFFKERIIGLRVAVLHSGLTDTQRLNTWMASATGGIDLVIATRLGVFVPMPKLGLVLVDEEHDPSYKQMEGLKYSARDLAVMLGQMCDCSVILGSATPSLETWHKVQLGAYGKISLSKRAVVGAALPVVDLVDLRHHTTSAGLSKPILEALQGVLAQGDQSIVFLNRRGYSPTLMCEACGWVAGCHQCSAHMVWHRAESMLRCHHCGVSRALPSVCPTCGNQDLTAFGRGTQRLEEALLCALPKARMLRIDADTTRGKGKAHQVFTAAHQGEADILVGTQMIAKGHDFQRVKLVVALNVDSALFSHQPKSAERLFAQLMQVSGRAGRTGEPGRFMVQTRYPHHPLFQCLCRQDYTGFAEYELQARKAAGYPPFTYQVLLRADHRKLDHAMDFLHHARQWALEWLEQQAWEAECTPRLCDPVGLTVVRVGGVERAQLLVESISRRNLHHFLDSWLLFLPSIGGSVRWFVDVDPTEI